MNASSAPRNIRAKLGGTILAANRSLISLATLLVGGLVAGGLSYYLGDGFRTAPPQAMETIGKIESLRIPVGARSLADLKSFIIRMGGADDYGRVYVNNYLALNREAPDLFYKGRDTQTKRDFISDQKSQRNVNKLGAIETKQYLHSGLNYIVVELENAIGPCVLEVDMTVNGTQLEYFPKLLPDGFQADKDTVTFALFRKFEMAQPYTYATSSGPEFNLDPLDDVVCARRIFAFRLK